MKLYDCVEIFADNDDCVVLKVKDGMKTNLITLGYFSGNETFFRLTKGKKQTCTVWEGDKNYDWYWGYGGHTMVSPAQQKRGELIQECIECDFGIEVVFW